VGQLAVIRDGDEIAIVIAVLESEVLAGGEALAEDSREHQYELVVGDLVVVDGESAAVIVECRFDGEAGATRC
jgi:hypothetical protein